MKVMLITGSYPPDVCGTADYSMRLSESLRALGLDVEVFYRKRWDLRNVLGLLQEIDRSKPDLLHMQYPTTGYGWKLGPQAIGALKPLVVTLHEASQAHILRQLSLYPFLMRSRQFIFTTAYERNYVARMAPWIASRSSIIPIGCNLRVLAGPVKQMGTVTCFGIIRPEKGLEDVIEVGRLLQARGSSVRIRITGAVMPRWTDYFSKLKSESKHLPIDWLTDLDDDALLRVLAETSLAYLPYPDGASERRSSLMAMLMNEACVLTTIGDQTPDAMKSCIVAAASPVEAATRIMDLLNHPGEIARFASLGAAYAQRFDWESIGQQHLMVYERAAQRQKTEVKS